MKKSGDKEFHEIHKKVEGKANKLNVPVQRPITVGIQKFRY